MRRPIVLLHRCAAAARLLAALAFVSAGLLAQPAAPSIDPALYQGLKWRNIGPFRGGRAVAVAGVPSDPRTFYFGGVGGGVWKTTDGGESWTNVSDGQVSTASVGAIAVAPSDPNVIYVGMGEHAVRGVMTSHGDGVYRSTDAGRTWRHMGLARTRQISRIRIHPTDPDTVYVAAQGAPYGPTEDRGIYRSVDGGVTWERTLFVNETTGASALSMDPTNPRILYAAMWDHLRRPWEVRSGGPGSAIYKSTDGGTRWEKTVEGLPETVGKIGVDVSADPDRVYAIVEADPGGGLYRSDDGGKQWRLMSGDWAIHSRAWYYMKVFADPRNPDVVWVTNASLMRSIDGGRTFSRVRTPHGDHHDHWIDPDDPRVLINANDGGATISYNGGATWSTQDNQPTAQFYRVNTDDRFPYSVYGGQQDNSSVAIASRAPGGISERDWHPIGGCESAYAAFDRANPRYVYAGCYMGLITEYDRETQATRDVMAYPMMPAALPPRGLKYRFNWNAPILVSQHDSGVIYHAGNQLLRSTNRGRTWEEISGDLTRDEESKQGPGGAPITNEGAGGETYGTIYYVAESPHDARTLWTGSDDGLVHVTRDGGASWQDVTPPGLGEALINAIEVSPHEPATAYVAASRYKFNDFTPHVFKTTNSGRSWDRLVEGIDDEAWVRVVREDPVRRDLLYAGTETGVYVSFDGGARWQSLQLDLPVTPITDLRIQSDDLVASTAGRAFWVLDNVSPLRQIERRLSDADAHLFAPRAAFRAAGGLAGGSSAPRVGRNPSAEAFIDFYVKEVPEAGLTIEILDAAGQVVRRYSTNGDDGAEPASPDGDAATRGRIDVEAGMNRIGWDLRHEPVTRVPGLYVFGSLQGRRVVPGTYQVRLTTGQDTLTQPIEVRPDPRVDATIADLQAQDDLLVASERELSAIHDTVIQLRDARSQIEGVVKRAASATDGEAVAKAGEALVEKLNALEDELVQKRTVDGQTVINFPMRLNQHYIFLRGAIDSGEDGPTDGARRRLDDLSAEWAKHRDAWTALLDEEIGAFNRLIREHDIPAVVVP